MAYDIEQVRSQFPSLGSGTAFFDGAAGTQTPEPVARAIYDSLVSPISNRGKGSASARHADDVTLAAREAMGDFLNADPAGVVFGRSMTAMTFDLTRTLSARWKPGDQIVVTSLEHDANLRPWLLAAQHAGAVVRWLDFDPKTGELPVETITAALNSRTRWVAITAASNVIGTKPDVAAISAAAHKVGARVHVDAVHLAAHELIDMRGLGADIISCSPYKFLGPHIGVQAASTDLWHELQPAKLAPSPNSVPERFEMGTLPYELLAGVRAAVDFLAGLEPNGQGERRERLETSMAVLHEHERQIAQALIEAVESVPGVTNYSRASERTPSVFFTVEELSASEISSRLAQANINAPASHFYALEACRRLGLGEAGAIRVSAAPYSTLEEVARFREALHAAVQQLRD